MSQLQARLEMGANSSLSVSLPTAMSLRAHDQAGAAGSSKKRGRDITSCCWLLVTCTVGSAQEVAHTAWNLGMGDGVSRIINGSIETGWLFNIGVADGSTLGLFLISSAKSSKTRWRRWRRLPSVSSS